MSWMRKKDKYWYFVRRVDGKEIQHYLGDDNRIIELSLPKEKEKVLKMYKKLSSRRRT